MSYEFYDDRCTSQTFGIVLALHLDGWSLRRSGMGGKSGDQRARERSSFV